MYSLPLLSLPQLVAWHSFLSQLFQVTFAQRLTFEELQLLWLAVRLKVVLHFLHFYGMAAKNLLCYWTRVKDFPFFVILFFLATILISLTQSLSPVFFFKHTLQGGGVDDKSTEVNFEMQFFFVFVWLQLFVSPQRLMRKSSLTGILVILSGRVFPWLLDTRYHFIPISLTFVGEVQSKPMKAVICAEILWDEKYLPALGLEPATF